MSEIRRSIFAKSVRQPNNIQPLVNNSAVSTKEDPKYVDFTVFSVHLEDGAIVVVDLSKTNNYRVKNGYLYKGLFKKISKIKFIRISK